jgi:hypothetical protein
MYISEDILFTNIIGSPEYEKAMEYNIQHNPNKASNVLSTFIDKNKDTQQLKNIKGTGDIHLNLLHGECGLVMKILEFSNSIESLASKTDYINNKVSNTDSSKSMITYVVYLYIVIYIYFLYQYIVALGSGDSEKAITFDIGFISNLAYIYLFDTLKNRFFEYSNISVTLGNLDTSVCSELSIIVNCLDSISKSTSKINKALIAKKTFESSSPPPDDLTACERSIVTNMYKIYDIVYIKKIFTSSKSHFKETVNSINKFIEKQKKYILKTENIDAASDSTTNDTMEAIYDVLVKGRPHDIFKSVQSAHAYRDTLSNNHDEYLKNKIIGPIINFMYKTNFNKVITNTNFESFFDEIQSVNSELRKLRDNYLPEYEQLKSFVYPIEMKELTKYSTEEFINIQHPATTIKDVSILEYFLKVKLANIQNGVIVPDDEYASLGSAKAEQIKKDVDLILTRISKRTSHRLNILEKYDKFILKMRGGYFDANSIQEYTDIYERIKLFFREKTSEYKLNDNIMLRYMNIILRQDDDMTTDDRNIVVINLKFIILKILKDISISTEIAGSILDSKNINTNKYIPFIKFESKMNLLSDSDMQSLDTYISAILVKIREFRKYIRTQENTFSKKFQLLSIYENMHRNFLNGSAILLLVYFYEQTLSDSFKAQSKEALGMFGNITGSVKDNIASKTGITSRLNKASDMLSSVKNKYGAKQGGAEAEEEQDDNKEDNDKEDDDKEDDAKSQKTSKSIKLASILIAFAVFFTFIKSYLMKHKADLNYDRIINVINTSKFELEVDNFSDKFKEYMKNRKDVSVCKELHYKIIEVVEIYDKCNFIKNSMRTTPFPFTEMWTNGIILIIFFAILYMTFVSTDAGQFWTNKATLDDLMKSTDKLFKPEYVNKQVDEKRSKFANLLAKFKASSPGDDSQLKNKLLAHGETMSDSTQFKKDVVRASEQESKTEKIKDYERVINSQFTKMSGGAQNQPMPMSQPMPMGQQMMAQPMILNQQSDPTEAETDILVQDTEVLRQYEKQYMYINNKLTYFNRDAKYVNVTLALSILLFGSYFCVTILDNSRRYQNMLSSGGVFGGKDCL